MRILIASDLHLESTGLETIRRFAAGVHREGPDAIVLAGDIGASAHLFEQCLGAFLMIDCPIAVLPGNADLWPDHDASSIMKFEHTLPEIARDLDYHWLETEPLLLPGGVAICGSIAWYDYSTAEPGLQQSDADILLAKPRCTLDAQRVNWEYSDPEFAQLCRERLARHVASLDADPDVSQVIVVTHMPVFESQLERDPSDEDLSLAAAYAGHLTLGEEIRRFGKVTHVVSGHTHTGQNGIVERDGLPPIATAVVPSDYGRPRWVTLEI